MEEEVWKDVPGYELRYQVSSLGNVKSLNYNNKGKNGLLRQGYDGKGYFNVKLYNDGIGKTIKVHQLVAMAFHNHIPDGHEYVVNHNNLIKADNRAVNLEITTSRENGNKKHIPSSSEFIGVYWSSKCNKWRAHIFTNKKLVYLGVFDSEIEAGECYQRALKAHNSGEKIIPEKKKFKGCYFNKNKNKWHSRIGVNGRMAHIGYFNNEADAIEAYQSKLKLIS